MTHRTIIHKIRTVSHKTEFTVTQATLTHKMKVWSNAPQVKWSTSHIVGLDIDLLSFTVVTKLSVLRVFRLQPNVLSRCNCSYCSRPAHMERTPVQPTRHWAIADYFQWTSENVFILRRVLRPRRAHLWHLWCICAVNKFTYLLTETS